MRRSGLAGTAGRVAIASALVVGLIATAAGGCLKILPPPAFDDATWVRDSDALARCAPPA
ncbi:MAG: hypothetical protein ACOYXU_12290 [Nitrospirota bacterium]